MIVVGCPQARREKEENRRDVDGIDRTASSQPVINAPDASLRVIENREKERERKRKRGRERERTREAE